MRGFVQSATGRIGETGADVIQTHARGQLGDVQLRAMADQDNHAVQDRRNIVEMLVQGVNALEMPGIFMVDGFQVELAQALIQFQRDAGEIRHLVRKHMQDIGCTAIGHVIPPEFEAITGDQPLFRYRTSTEPFQRAS